MEQKVDRKMVEELLLSGKFKSQEKLASHLQSLGYGKISRQRVSQIKMALAKQGKMTGNKQGKKAVVAKTKNNGNGDRFPTFEELEAILSEKAGAIDKMISVIAIAKQAETYKEEAEKFKRGYNNLMEAVAAEKKAEKKKSDQRLAYQLAVQKGELPRLTEHIISLPLYFISEDNITSLSSTDSRIPHNIMRPLSHTPLFQYAKIQDKRVLTTT